MADPVVAKIQAWLREHEDALLDDTRRMLQIPSIEADAEADAPFGAANRHALDLALDMAKAWGMATTDLEGYCGYADFGSGEKLIMVLGHLDVVPVGPGWKYDPFSATVDGGYIYARGAVDDKGPTMAAFYALRALQEVAGDLGVRFRIVFGCNEESGFQCIERYVKTEESPTFGFAPDAGWPLYHAEKGIANLIVDFKLPTDGLALVSLEGGQRPNIVIDQARAKAKVSADVRAEVEEKIAKSWDANLKAELKGDWLEIEAKGKAAHGAWPFGGDSAAIRILRFLMEIAPTAQKTIYEELFELADLGGVGLGIHGRDDVSDLTNNLGIVATQGDTLRMTFNVRYPVTWKGEQVKSRCEANLKEKKGSYQLADFTDSTPLYFPLEHPLVKTVVDVYAEETGERRRPGVMGGGTYARAIPNTVAIGTGWEGDGEAHQTDERLKVENLFKMSRIYAHILYRLAKA